MARKRRAPSPPPPPPPPPQESSTDSGSDTDGEEESRRAAAHQKPPQNLQAHPPAAAADGAASSDGESDSDADADAFQMRPVSHPGSDPDETSEPEDPEPVRKKAAAATNKPKTAVPEDKKRPAPEPAPSGRAKKAKAEAGKAAPEATPAGKGKKASAERQKAAPEATPAGKGKKANAEQEKAAHEATPAGKGKKAKKSVGKSENSGLDLSPPSKSARTPHRWSKEDLIRILEAIVAHVKTVGTLPKTEVLLAAVRDRLDRKDCTYTDMYEKVRRFKERYEKAVANGVVPNDEDELQIYNLSEAIWGEKAKEAMAAAAAGAASQNNPTVTKGKKGQAKKEKPDGNSKGGTVREVPNQSGDSKKGSKKGHAVEVKTDKDTIAASPSKNKKLANGKQELGKDAKSGTSKATTTTSTATATATQNGDALTKSKKEKMDKDKMDIDTHQEETEIGASVQGTHRSFDELQNLFPCLADYVKRIEAESTCGETLKRAFGFIGDEKADVLESRIKALRLLELKAQIRRDSLQKEVINMFINLAE